MPLSGGIACHRGFPVEKIPAPRTMLESIPPPHVANLPMPIRTRIAAPADIPLGEGREFVVGTRIVAVFRTSDGWSAIDGICSHAGGPLAQGKLSGNVVTCPWHGWQYDLSTGHHCLNSRIQQSCFVVEEQGDDLFVTVPD